MPPRKPARHERVAALGQAIRLHKTETRALELASMACIARRVGVAALKRKRLVGTCSASSHSSALFNASTSHKAKRKNLGAFAARPARGSRLTIPSPRTNPQRYPHM